jgi:hypothetical protein
VGAFSDLKSNPVLVVRLESVNGFFCNRKSYVHYGEPVNGLKKNLFLVEHLESVNDFGNGHKISEDLEGTITVLGRTDFLAEQATPGSLLAEGGATSQGLLAGRHRRRTAGRLAPFAVTTSPGTVVFTAPCVLSDALRWDKQPRTRAGAPAAT